MGGFTLPLVGRAGVGGGQGLSNDDAHAFQIAQHVAGQQAQGADSFAGEDGVAGGVMGALGIAAVMHAIYFDHQPASIADEIEHIATEWCLMAEILALSAQAAQKSPQAPFGQRCRAPQFAGLVNFGAIRSHTARVQAATGSMRRASGGISAWARLRS